MSTPDTPATPAQPINLRTFFYVGLPSGLIAAGLTVFCMHLMHRPHVIEQSLIHLEQRQARIETVNMAMAAQLDGMAAMSQRLVKHRDEQTEFGVLTDKALDEAINSLIDQIEDEEVGAEAEGEQAVVVDAAIEPEATADDDDQLAGQ